MMGICIGLGLLKINESAGCSILRAADNKREETALALASNDFSNTYCNALAIYTAGSLGFWFPIVLACFCGLYSTMEFFVFTIWKLCFVLSSKGYIENVPKCLLMLIYIPIYLALSLLGNFNWQCI